MGIINFSIPTILKIGVYRFFFYAGDRNESPHVHVENESKIAKIWLDPIRLQFSKGLNRNEINQVVILVAQNQKMILDKWNEYFNDWSNYYPDIKCFNFR